MRTRPLVSRSSARKTLSEAELSDSVLLNAPLTESRAQTAVPSGGISQAQSRAKPSSLIFRAALTSLLSVVPHLGQIHVRRFAEGASAAVCPHTWQILVEGK